MFKNSKESFLPFGSQYYRAPSPLREDWERDLKRMKNYGFNLVKFWVQWRWNHPAENAFYFDDIDELMDLSERYGLKVMLNTIFDVAPAWIYDKYPDASMVTLSGRKVGPQTQPHRQIGGLGYCFNHDGVMSHFFHFLEETVNRYKDHPALAVWNVGSEPELTSSMAEMREYADNAEKIGDMLCYCSNCRETFKTWLQSRYVSIEQLNVSWNRNYTSFRDAELPLTRNTFNDIVDWRMFFVHTLGENVKKRFEKTQAIDKGKHPLMCHHVFIQGFPVTSTASDPWNVGRFGDLHGFTQMDDPCMIDVLRSCAKGKPVISAEMLMLNGYTLDMPKSINDNDIKRFIFSGIAGNLKGFIFWQYRPEILGREAPAWGLTTLDGKETPWLKAFARVGQSLRKHSDLILSGTPKSAETAILYNPENQIFSWASTGNEKTATHALLGAHKALYENNYSVDFIHPADINPSLLDRYKTIIIPFPYLISREVCALLGSWVEAGGLLIGESYFAGWNREEGHHERIVPGHGLHHIFKARQGVVDPVKTNDLIDIIPVDEMINENHEYIKGSIVQERLIPEGADVLAFFPDGSPAITAAGTGKGYAILVGSYVFLPLFTQNVDANARFFAHIMKKYSGISVPRINPPAKIRVDVIQDNAQKTMLIVRNLQAKAVIADVTLKQPLPSILTEEFSSEKLSVKHGDSEWTFSVSLKPGEVNVYCD